MGSLLLLWQVSLAVFQESVSINNGTSIAYCSKKTQYCRLFYIEYMHIGIFFFQNLETHCLFSYSTIAYSTGTCCLGRLNSYLISSILLN